MKLFGLHFHSAAKLRGELSVARDRIAALQRARVRAVPERRFPAERIRLEIAALAGSEGWAALHQELDAAIADAVDEVSTPPPARPGEVPVGRDFAAGGLDFLRRFQQRLLDLEHAASIVDKELQ